MPCSFSTGICVQLRLQILRYPPPQFRPTAIALTLCHLCIKSYRLIAETYEELHKFKEALDNYKR